LADFTYAAELDFKSNASQVLGGDTQAAEKLRAALAAIIGPSGGGGLANIRASPGRPRAPSDRCRGR